MAKNFLSRRSASAVNSRPGAAAKRRACANRWSTCAPMVISQANMPHGRAGQFAGVAPRAIRANGRQATLAPVQEDSARARGLHPGQFAPGGGELRSRLYEPLAHVRGGGYLPGKHAAWQRRTIRAFGSWSPVGTVQDRPSRQARLVSYAHACLRGENTSAPRVMLCPAAWVQRHAGLCFFREAKLAFPSPQKNADTKP